MTRFETLEKMTTEALDKRGFRDSEREAANVRLKQELEIVKQTGCAEMFLAAEEMSRKAREEHLYLDPSPADGSSLSMLCFLLGISIDNPLRYPEYPSFADFENGLKTRKLMTFLCYDAGLNSARNFLNRRYPNGEAKDFGDSFTIKVPAAEEHTGFSIHLAVDYESARRERILYRISSQMKVNIDLNSIPLNDKSSFDLFNALDWDGVTDNVVFTKVMREVKEKKPDTILKIWQTINTPVYQVFGNTGEKFNVEWFATAIRIYHLAYLKAHYRTAFDSTLEVERASKMNGNEREKENRN